MLKPYTFSRLFYACLLSLIYYSANAQQVTLRWSTPAKVLDLNFNPTEVLFFEGAKVREDLLPYYVINLENKTIGEFTLINPVYNACSAKETAILHGSIIPNEPIIVHGIQNKKTYSEISFVPLRKNSVSGQYEKLISFSYQYTLTATSVTLTSKKITAEKKSNAKTQGVTSTTSVLSGGSWYKLSINESGIYKIDYTFLKTIGLNPDQLDPRRLKLFGNGGAMLPQANNLSRPDDLLENAIFISGEADGKFDPNDYILFYGHGPNNWTYNSTESIFNHTKNIYSDVSCYFLTADGGFGNRVSPLPDLGSGAQTITTFDDYLFHENETVNLLNSGRLWFGESFDQSLSNSFSFSTQGIVAGSTLYTTCSVLGRSTASTSFTVSLNNAIIGSQSISSNNLSTYDAKGKINRTIHASVLSSSPSSVTIGLTYNKGSSFTSIGNLDYIEINFKRTLALYNNQTSFRSIASTSTASSTYQVANGAGNTIWNITDFTATKNQAYTTSGSTAIFSASSSSLEEYVVFSGTNFPAPTYIGLLTNQNLHGINSPNLPDLVILSHPDFVAQANQLADFRRTFDNLSVVVVTPELIYNEFSSGVQDITAIRDFMKMLYDRKTPTDSVRYLLLFGDCSYDYKNRISSNTNFVPTYQSRESLYPLLSYSSDDYFGFLDDSEGNWGENPAENDKLDIGIGRIPVKTPQEAIAAIEKLMHYSSSLDGMGKWRNKISFIADDGDGNLHQSDAEDLSIKVDSDFPSYNIQKVYLDAYIQQPTPGGEKCPDVNLKIDQLVNNGTFVLNYSGHGGETGWAQEAILGIPQIESWTNFNNMPFMITATCDFGRYDDPGVISGAEYAVLRQQGGAIAVISAARVVYAFSNKALNLQIYNTLFEPLMDGTMPRLGDVILQTKNVSIVGVNNRSFSLIGDPSLRLVYPQEKIITTKINNITVSAVPDTMKALSKITINGEIRNASNTKLTSFNGKLFITIYDKKTNATTFGTQNTLPFNYFTQSNFLFDGSSSITNGDWSVTFVVPKDISYQYDVGKISLYAAKSNVTQDAGGYYDNIIIGGTDPNAPEDNTPPRIRLFMNDESFVFGGLTNKDALFIAKLSDENGINTAGSGIGHEITSYLDNENSPAILNEFYSADLNDYQNGKVNYPYTDLTPGPHVIRFKAWDTYNNSAEERLEFVVANNEKIALSHILNYPNPFSTKTTFHFDHNRAGEELDVMIQIYTISGKLIKTLDTKIFTSSAHFAELDWNGRDDFGDQIGKGVYVYRVWVRAPRDGSTVHQYQKLVLLK